MSLSRGSSRETQALVQSMLQRLKLQSGTEIQGDLFPASPAAATHDSGQNRDRAPHRQTLGSNSRPAQNGFGMALVDSPGTVNGEQGLLNGPILDSRLEMARLNSPKAFFSTSCKDNTARNIVESGGTKQTVTSSAVSGCVFPVITQKGAEGTSFARTDVKLEGGKEGNGNSVIEESAIHDVLSGAVGDYRNVNSSVAGNSTSAAQFPSNSHSSNPGMTAESGALSQTLNRDSSPSTVQGFSPRVFAWSLKGLSTGSGEIPTAHQENEDSGSLAQSQDVEIGSKMPSSTLAPLQRNRASGNKTKRWTQKIKEKFRERGGSLKKKAEKEDVKGKEEGKISTPDEYRNTNDGSSVPSRTLESTSKPTDTASRNLEDSAVEMRSNNDFDIGLGSFSLLEEIKTGQYWANFLSPTLSDVSTSQTAAQQHAGHSNSSALAGFQEGTQSSRSLDQLGNPAVAVMATSPADLPVPVPMDSSEPDGSLVAMVMDPRAEPMEQHSQSDVVSEELGLTPGERDQVDLHFIKNAGIVSNTILKSKILNRKRAHRRSLERTGNEGKAEEGGERDGKGALQDEPLSSFGLANGPFTVNNEFAGENGLLYLYPFKSHQRPSSPAPSEFVPKGILKHTHCTDSECSIPMETAAKKRRMEAGRQVRFSEEVVAIAPVVFDISMGTDSEEESRPEENSETEEENGRAPGVGANEKDEAPARPPALPGWIRALRRRSRPKR